MQTCTISGQDFWMENWSSYESGFRPRTDERHHKDIFRPASNRRVATYIKRQRQSQQRVSTCCAKVDFTGFAPFSFGTGEWRENSNTSAGVSGPFRKQLESPKKKPVTAKPNCCQTCSLQSRHLAQVGATSTALNRKQHYIKISIISKSK